MKSRNLLFSLACFSLAAPASADTFVLKDGSRLEGRILKENPDSYVLEVQITKSIKDEKTVAKADVEAIETEKVDEKSFEKLKNLVPTPDLLPSAEYDKRIQAVTAFLKEHPKSAKLADANAILSTLKAEAPVVEAGGFKLAGAMVSAADYKANLYEMDAKILESRIRGAVGQGNYVQALRGFKLLETDFVTTASRKALLPLKRQVLQSYKAQINEQLTEYAALMADRKSALARMSKEDRNRAESGMAEEVASLQKARQAEEASDQRWKTTNPLDRESLVQAKDAIESELTDEIPVEEIDGGKFYRDILKEIQDSKDKEAAGQAFSRSGELEFPEKYLAILQAAAKAKGVTF